MSTVHLDLTGSLPNLEPAMHKLAALAVARTAFAIEAAAKAKCPVDTGALRTSISAITAAGGNENNYGEAAALNPNAQMAGPPRVADDLDAYVTAPMAYAAFVEYGTRFMPAKPFLTPAFEEAGGELQEAFAELGGSLEQSIFQEFRR